MSTLRVPISIERYHRLVATGELGPGDRVELLEGELVAMSPTGTPHRFCVHALFRRLSQSLPGERYCVFLQSPITLDASEPEPDGCVARGTDEDYRRRHPGVRRTCCS